ncbi:class I SAM-dependent DNA methyltransferase [Peribacillus alkalitolerans]|uniref:class I SAM-dependent DNA methyltransferase n=1 Tax=Peribacillus alkalitolerans TaxID=1550385 RepID=UPI0013D1CAC6|nr:class I SAM-dependent methyltransferase [Peribacillus alkalitolerans]
MSYHRFAEVYDALMKDVPYDLWVERFVEQAQKLRKECNTILDIGCGTGEIAIRFAKKGYNVTGVDLSEEMLMIASEKSAQHDVNIPFFQQDMKDLEGLGEFDAVVIFCDSLNYLLDENDVKSTFSKVHQHLVPGGLFMFDVHSLYKMEHLFHNQTYAIADDDVSYIWNCFEGDHPHSVEHELSFFILDEETDFYRRFDELHHQRTFKVESYKQWLVDAGFDLLDTLSDLENLPLHDSTERVLFVAKKR